MLLLKSILPALAILTAIFPDSGAQSVFALDNTKYCNAVQNKVGLIRYPLGTIGISSTDSGEIANVMTLVPRVYPCLDSVVVTMSILWQDHRIIGCSLTRSPDSCERVDWMVRGLRLSIQPCLSANAFTVRVQPGITCGLYPMT